MAAGLPGNLNGGRIGMINVKKNREIDYEWLELMKEAKTIGLTLEEVRLFLAGIKQNE